MTLASTSIRTFAWLFGSLTAALCLLARAVISEKPEELVWPLAVVGAVLVWQVVTRIPLTWTLYSFIFLIVFAAFVPLSINVQGLNLRVSEAFLPIVWIKLLAAGAISRFTRQGLKLAAAGGLLWGAFLFWTLFNMESYSSALVPLGRVALLGINLLHAAAIYLLVVTTGRWHRAVACFLFSTALFNLFLLAVSNGTLRDLLPFEKLLSLEAAPVLSGGALTGGEVARFRVGVVTGNLSVAMLMIVTALQLDPRKRAGSHWRWLAAGIAVLGIVIGFSRQAVVGLVAGFAVITLYLLRQGRLRRLGVLALLIPMVGVLFWGAAQMPAIQPFFEAFAGRAWLLLEPAAYASGTAGERMEMWKNILADVCRNPLAGAGQDAYMIHYPSTRGGGSHNFPVEILHATGLSGFLAYVYLHGAIILAAWRALARRRLSVPDRWLMLGLLAAFVVVVLSSWTNLIFSSQTYWLVLGLLAAGVCLTRHSRTAMARYMTAPSFPLPLAQTQWPNRYASSGGVPPQVEISVKQRI